MVRRRCGWLKMVVELTTIDILKVFRNWKYNKRVKTCFTSESFPDETCPYIKIIEGELIHNDRERSW
jgi:hypothetical protein